MQINDIQKIHLTQYEYETIVLRPQYESNQTILDGVAAVNKNLTNIDDDCNTIEVLVISEEDAEQEQKLVDNEFEEFELLEVDHVDANHEIDDNKIKNDDHSKTNEKIDLIESNEIEIENAKDVMPIKTRSRRIGKDNKKSNSKTESTRKSVRQAAARVKHEVQTPRKTFSTATVKQTPKSNSKTSKEFCLDDDAKYDVAESERDNEFPSRDSDNEDWPSQETLSEFPKEIIKDGLLQVKGKELMSLICRYASLKKKIMQSQKYYAVIVFFLTLDFITWNVNYAMKNEGSSK